MKRNTVLPGLLAVFGVAVLTFVWAGPLSPLVSRDRAGYTPGRGTPLTPRTNSPVVHPDQTPTLRETIGLTVEPRAATTGVHTGTSAPTPAAETPHAVPYRGSPRLRILNRDLGIPLEELEKKSPDEIERIYEENACQLGVSIGRRDPESDEMVTIINKPTCEALGTPWPTPRP
jgi:hypothetical protein